MNKRHAGLSALMSLVLLAGCSEVNQFLGKEESVNYKSAVSQRGEPLSIPPDLTQAASDPRYRAPVSGSTTYSQFQQQGQTQATAPKSTNVLPDRQDMRVERDGDLRWLVINRPPEDIFPRVVDFWTESGFTIQSNNPKAGLIETDWAENRAKIPEAGCARRWAACWNRPGIAASARNSAPVSSASTATPRSTSAIARCWRSASAPTARRSSGRTARKIRA